MGQDTAGRGGRARRHCREELGDDEDVDGRASRLSSAWDAIRRDTVNPT